MFAVPGAIVFIDSVRRSYSSSSFQPLVRHGRGSSLIRVNDPNTRDTWNWGHSEYAVCHFRSLLMQRLANLLRRYSVMPFPFRGLHAAKFGVSFSQLMQTTKCTSMCLTGRSSAALNLESAERSKCFEASVRARHH